MDLKTGIEIAGFALLVISNLVVIVSVFTGIRKDVGFLRTLYTQSAEHTKIEIARIDGLNEKHFAHAANTGIHQESMSKDTLTLHFSTMNASILALTEQFRAHTEEDMTVIRTIGGDLKEIRERLANRRREVQS